jgi:hypothetical protein
MQYQAACAATGWLLQPEQQQQQQQQQQQDQHQHQHQHQHHAQTTDNAAHTPPQHQDMTSEELEMQLVSNMGGCHVPAFVRLRYILSVATNCCVRAESLRVQPERQHAPCDSTTQMQHEPTPYDSATQMQIDPQSRPTHCPLHGHVWMLSQEYGWVQRRIPWNATGPMEDGSPIPVR